MTFRELYDKEKEIEKATEKPSMAFIRRVAAAACASEATVRSWLCGSRTPDQLAKKAIAEELGETVEELFPEERRLDHDPYIED